MFKYANMAENGEMCGPVQYSSAAASVEPVDKTLLCERFHIVNVTKCTYLLFDRQNRAF